MLTYMLEYVIIGLMVWIAVYFLFLRRRRKNEEDGEAIDPVRAATRIKYYYDASAHPRDLLEHPPFVDAAQGLTRSERSDADLLAYANGDNPVVACMALEALAGRVGEKVPTDELLRCLRLSNWWVRYFALRALDARHPEAIAARVLTRVDAAWAEPLPVGIMADFLDRRSEKGDVPSLQPLLASVPSTTFNALRQLVKASRTPLLDAVRKELEDAAGERVDVDLLTGIGLLREPERGSGDSGPAPLLTTEQQVAEEAILRFLLDRRSVVVTGEAGVGKSTTLNAVVEMLRRKGWYIWRASAGDLIAGQSYIGQLEERLKKVVEALGGRRVVWIVPDLVDLVWAGRYQQRPVGILDMILPELSGGTLVLAGEARASALETLHREQPRLRTLLHTVRVSPADEQESLAVAARWFAQGSAAAPSSDRILHEAFLLARQYLGDRALPGSLMHLLKSAGHHLEAAGPAGTELTIDVLITALAGLTGLPRAILDDRADLSIESVRAHFSGRVLGQSEAVECLVERIAMIKAGVTDPGRPQGVFLFVGPTGTGKTEIAKSLAEYLFGSPDRMIRLDMSEFKTPDSLERLTGSSQPGTSDASLVTRIRHEPFSLVLLDEVEKAHPNVWDLFLQIFDDGRLTDQQGRTADFRHALIILTSNLGAAVQSGRGVGFGSPARSWSMASIQKSLEETFRPEFLNRLDRVVPFRPLGPDVMRGLLDKELRELLQRRGLRNREWAIEWESSAIELLLEKGFSLRYGARPLRRAVERYLLTPLALAIVERAFPEGDAFLFIRREKDRIEVEWVDPDEMGADLPPTDEDEITGDLVLESIVLDGTGARREVDALQAEYEHLGDVIGSPEWVDRKAQALAAMAAPGFWERDDRFVALGLVEYRDRIEVGFQTAGSLLRRLGQGRSKRFPLKLVRRLAQRLYLLGIALEELAAGVSGEAFLRVAAKHYPGGDGAAADAFALKLTDMYRAWAEKRGMRLEEPQTGRDAAGEPVLSTLAVSGFGAYSILAPEAGLHVFETPGAARSFRRVTALVTVAPQPAVPADSVPEGLSLQAEQALVRVDATHELTVVRRYREEPSPLVRDAVRQWRTGRADTVFAGDFDLIC